MKEEYGVFQTANGDALSQGELRQVCYVVKSGGVAILPSDTSWGLVVYPFRRDSLAKLEIALPEKASDPIPLSFGSLDMVSRYVKLQATDERLIDSLMPGPLTLVCEIANSHEKRQIDEMLHTHGTIGVRISKSAVERQVSIELQRPITTCAIRDDSGNPVRSFDEAFDLVRTRLKAGTKQFLLSAVRNPQPSVSGLVNSCDGSASGSTSSRKDSLLQLLVHLSRWPYRSKQDRKHYEANLALRLR